MSEGGPHLRLASLPFHLSQPSQHSTSSLRPMLLPPVTPRTGGRQERKAIAVQILNCFWAHLKVNISMPFPRVHIHVTFTLLHRIRWLILRWNTPKKFLHDGILSGDTHNLTVIQLVTFNEQSIGNIDTNTLSHLASRSACALGCGLWVVGKKREEKREGNRGETETETGTLRPSVALSPIVLPAGVPHLNNLSHNFIACLSRQDDDFWLSYSSYLSSAPRRKI